MALQTREQHIRKDKATSNICTAQALLAIMASFYALYHGQEGLKNISLKIHTLSSILYNGLVNIGIKVKHKYFFDTLTIVLTETEKEIINREALSKKINLWLTKEGVQISIDETTTEDDILNLIHLFTLRLNKKEKNEKQVELTYIPSPLLRQSPFLESQEFKKYQTETEMMRYIKHLENKDLSLCHSMIALGSCTMKLNPASTMYPVSLPEFATLHPFAPKNQTQGYTKILEEFEKLFELCEESSRM